MSEIWKWVKTAERGIELFFYRTRSGLEVDLLLTTPAGVLGIEAKSAARLGVADRRGLREVGKALGSAWRGGFIVHGGASIERLEQNLWSVPADRLLV